MENFGNLNLALLSLRRKNAAIKCRYEMQKPKHIKQDQQKLNHVKKISDKKYKDWENIIYW